MLNQVELFDFEIDGVGAYASVLAGAAFELSQLGPGKLQGHHTRARTAEVEISWVRTNLALRGIGHLPDDVWTISLVLESESHSTQHGIEVGTGSLVVHGPGAVHDGVYGGGFSVVCFGVPSRVFEHRVQHQFPDLKELLGKQWEIYSASELTTDGLITEFEAAVQLLRSDHSIQRSATAINSMCEELLYDYLLTLLDANQVVGHTAESSALEILRTAEQSMHDSLDRTWTVGDLCHTVGVSRRTLNRAFHQAVGMGPSTYLRRIRLNAARNCIIDGNRRDQTITDIATSLGFWHLGRFAEQYRELFGESPSQSRSPLAAESKAG